MNDREQYEIMIKNDPNFVVGLLIEKNNQLLKQDIEIEDLQQERDKYKSIIDKLREYMLDIDYKMGWQYVNYLDDLLEEGNSNE